MEIEYTFTNPFSLVGILACITNYLNRTGTYPTQVILNPDWFSKLSDITDCYALWVDSKCRVELTPRINLYNKIILL